MKTLKLWLAIVSLVTLSGCVTPLALEEQTPNPAESHPDKLIIAVVDDRARIIDKGVEPTFVGVAHGSFGIPFDWHLTSVLATENEDKQRNLAQFLEYRLTKGFQESGWNVSPANIHQFNGSEHAGSLLAEHNAQKLLVIDLKEWYFSINLNWVSAFNFDTDSIVQVYEVENGKLVSKRFKERDEVEEFANESHTNLILQAYRDQLVQMITDPEIKAALSQ